MSNFTDELIGRELRGTTADTALIKRALEQAKERITDWSGDFQGEIFAKNTLDLLNLAIQEAEKLQ